MPSLRSPQALLCAGLSLALALVARAGEPAFKAYGAPTALFSSGVKLTSSVPLFFTSGSGAGKDAPPTVKGQALASFKNLEANLALAGFTLDDVVIVKVCLAPGPDGKVDFAGWNEAWKETFGTATHPNKPARTTLAVPAIGRPGTLVGELECVCAAPTEPAFSAGSDALHLPVANPQLKPYGKIEGRFYTGMGVKPGAALYWTAGVGAPVVKADAPVDSPEKYGDIATQTRGVLAKLQENLAGVGLTFADVLSMHAWVGPDKLRDGQAAVAGWNTTYDEFFNNPKNPHKPARSTIQTPTFTAPGAMLEVELIAAFPAAPAADKVAFDTATNPQLKTFGSPKAPISSGVAVKPGARLYFSAGTGPKIDGDMKTQALSALELLKTRMAEAGVGFKDIVFLRAYVVPGADGVVDRKGWGEAYATYFGTPENPHKPARTTIAVSALPGPFYKIEVEAIAAVP